MTIDMEDREKDRLKTLIMVNLEQLKNKNPHENHSHCRGTSTHIGHELIKVQ